MAHNPRRGTLGRGGAHRPLPVASPSPRSSPDLSHDEVTRELCNAFDAILVDEHHIRVAESPKTFEEDPRLDRIGHTRPHEPFVVLPNFAELLARG